MQWLDHYTFPREAQMQVLAQAVHTKQRALTGHRAPHRHAAYACRRSHRLC